MDQLFSFPNKLCNSMAENNSTDSKNNSSYIQA